MSSFRSQPGQPKGKLLSVERVVALLTPLFGAGAGWLTSIIAKAIPGVDLNPAEITAMFGTGTAAGIAAALKWLHGRAKFVELEREVALGAHGIENTLGPVLGSAPAQDIEALLEAHREQIIKDVDQHLPNVAQEIIAQLWPPKPGGPPPSQAPQGQSGPVTGH